MDSYNIVLFSCLERNVGQKRRSPAKDCLDLIIERTLIIVLVRQRLLLNLLFEYKPHQLKQMRGKAKLNKAEQRTTKNTHEIRRKKASYSSCVQVGDGPFSFKSRFFPRSGGRSELAPDDPL